MASLIPWLLLALAGAQPPVDIPPPPAPSDETLAIGRDYGDRMTVDVRLNGTGPYRFVIDTGADRSVVTRPIAATLALPVAAPVRMHGIAGLETVNTVRIDSLTVGARTIAGVIAPALDREGVGGDGLLGIDALAGQRVVMDFIDHRMTVTASPDRSPPPEPGTVVVTARRRFGQLILTDAAVLGRRIRAVIDTGADVSVGNLALQRLIARRRGSTGTPGLLMGVTGRTVAADVAIVSRLRIGGVTLTDVPVAFADIHTFARFGLADDPALLVGMDVLRVFRRVAVDFQRRTIQFRIPSADPTR